MKGPSRWGASGWQQSKGGVGQGEGALSANAALPHPDPLDITGGRGQLPTLTQVSVWLISHTHSVLLLRTRDGKGHNPSTASFVPPVRESLSEQRRATERGRCATPCDTTRHGEGPGVGRANGRPRGLVPASASGLRRRRRGAGGCAARTVVRAGPPRTASPRIVLDAPAARNGLDRPGHMEPRVVRNRTMARACGGTAERPAHGVPRTDRCRDRAAVPCRPVTAPERGPTTPGPHLPREDGVSSLRCPHRRRAPGWLWGRPVQRRGRTAVTRRMGDHRA